MKVFSLFLSFYLFLSSLSFNYLPFCTAVICSHLLSWLSKVQNKDPMAEKSNSSTSHSANAFCSWRQLRVVDSTAGVPLSPLKEEKSETNWRNPEKLLHSLNFEIQSESTSARFTEHQTKLCYDSDLARKAVASNNLQFAQCFVALNKIKLAK